MSIPSLLATIDATVRSRRTQLPHHVSQQQGFGVSGCLPYFSSLARRWEEIFADEVRLLYVGMTRATHELRKARLPGLENARKFLRVRYRPGPSQAAEATGLTAPGTPPIKGSLPLASRHRVLKIAVT